MPPGDTFNFIFIARFLTEGSYPENEKRLPFYGALLIPWVYLPLDPVAWGKAITGLAGLASAGLLYLLAVELGLPAWAGVLAASLGLLDPVFLWSSTRALSDVPYVALALASLWLLVRAWRRESPRTGLWAGVMAGLAGLTRPEGVIVLGLVTASLAWRALRTRRQAWIWGIVALILIMAPWAAFNTKRYGAPWGSPYLKEARGEDYGAQGAREVAANIPRVLDLVVLGEKAGVSEPATEIRSRLADPGALIAYLRAQPFATALLVRAWLYGLFFLAGILAMARSYLPGLLALSAVFFGHLMVVAWWSPSARFALMLFPLTTLFVAGGAFLPPLLARWGRVPDENRSRRSPGGFPVAASLALALLLVGLTGWRSYRHTQGQLARDNYRGYSLYTAIMELRRRDGRVFIPSDSYIMARIYLGRLTYEPPYRGVYLNLQRISTVEQEVEALRDRNVRYVLRHFRDADLPLALSDPSNAGHFSLIARFGSPNPRFAEEWTEIWEFLPTRALSDPS